MNTQIEKIRKFAFEKRESMTALALVGYQTAFNEILVFIDDLDQSKHIGKWGYFWDSEFPKSCVYRKLNEYRYDIVSAPFYYVDHLKAKWKNFSLTIPEHLNK
jgi:hypothetical protein